MIRVVLEILLAAVFSIWGYCLPGSDLQPELYGMAIGCVGVLAIELIIWLIEDRRLLRLYWDCIKPFQRPELRLSIAYLFKIEVQGKYLLVRSSRITDCYQPVGGVYKYFQAETSTEFNDLTIITDTAITNDDASEFDLRVKMQDRRMLPKFLKWFQSQCDRELDPWREFYEELVKTRILPGDKFKYVHYSLIAQHFEPIHFDKHFKIDTFKYVDIFKPKFVCQQQLDEVKQLQAQTSTDYIWATEEEIKKGVTDDGKRIADHSYKIFHTKKLN